MLNKENLEFEYEPYKIVLSSPFVCKHTSIEKKKKILQPISPKIRAITYTPDFVGNKWIMETKGLRKPDFDLK